MIHEEYYDYITEKFKEEETEWRQLILFHQKLDYEISNTGIVRNKKTMTVLKHQVKEKYPTVSIRYNDGTVNSKEKFS